MDTSQSDRDGDVTTRSEGMEFPFSTRLKGMEFLFSIRLKGMEFLFSTRFKGMEILFSTRLKGMESLSSTRLKGMEFKISIPLRRVDELFSSHLKYFYFPNLFAVQTSPELKRTRSSLSARPVGQERVRFSLASSRTCPLSACPPEQEAPRG